ncbi:Z1 domain-containing protein [Mucilaginibacter kameinonensis]|uniref:Z1 domain-containing protein n=1 Tax=Mucilaginibacter kameinonensis TaxID=452286 RepID=UPI0013CE86B4|nr:Z1 domain-containing protein [Mucilaginibacter kameinonensis]
MNHLQTYLSIIGLQSSSLRDTVEETSRSVYQLIEDRFDYRSHITGLLLGNVQSGKTGQLLGVVTNLADRGFELFVLLTTDNIYLQKQTKERTEASLPTFNVYGEDDDVPFLSDRLVKPLIVVLKKNSSVLKRWRNTFASSGYCSGRPIVIIDDEADAASLNTLVNKDKVSTINKHLGALKELSASSLYLEVTATPQAILLQSNISGWKPAFIYYFKPGSEYIGGDFIYAQPKPYCIQFTDEDELGAIKNEEGYIPEGLKVALFSYLIVCAHYHIKGVNTCNFLVHPSVKINDHLTFSNVLGEHLNEFLLAVTDDTESFIRPQLEAVWNDLRTTKPDIESFEDVFEAVAYLLENELITVMTMNSTSAISINYQVGYNIIVGGNSLGRGVTFPKLQTVYYCRKAKTPQADTFWQHARMFGYDRDRGLLRIFLPPSLYNLFSELNISNKLLINQITHADVKDIQLFYPKGVQPTRKNVLDNKALNLIMGGVNFFSSYPRQDNGSIVDNLVDDYDEKEHYHVVNSSVLAELLKYVGDEANEDWDNQKYINTVSTLATKRPTTRFALIVRKGRDIGKGTGTLLSPTDRRIGDGLKNWVVLTLYKVNGSTDKGWLGAPFYIPNIRLPDGVCIYDTIDI